MAILLVCFNVEISFFFNLKDLKDFQNLKSLETESIDLDLSGMFRQDIAVLSMSLFQEINMKRNQNFYQSLMAKRFFLNFIKIFEKKS